MKFTLGLECGGLMEMPDWKIEYIREVEANSLDEAKDKWAAAVGLDKDFNWNKETKRYWGWEVVNVSQPVKHMKLIKAIVVKDNHGPDHVVITTNLPDPMPLLNYSKPLNIKFDVIAGKGEELSLIHI